MCEHHSGISMLYLRAEGLTFLFEGGTICLTSEWAHHSNLIGSAELIKERTLFTLKFLGKHKGHF